MSDPANPVSNEELAALLKDFIATQKVEATRGNALLDWLLSVALYVRDKVGTPLACVLLGLAGIWWMVTTEGPIKAAIEAQTAAYQSMKLERDAQAEKTRLEIQKLQGP